MISRRILRTVSAGGRRRRITHCGHKVEGLDLLLALQRELGLDNPGVLLGNVRIDDDAGEHLGQEELLDRVAVLLHHLAERLQDRGQDQSAVLSSREKRKRMTYPGENGQELSLLELVRPVEAVEEIERAREGPKEVNDRRTVAGVTVGLELQGSKGVVSRGSNAREPDARTVSTRIA